MAEISETLGDRLRRAMKAKDASNGDLAEWVGVHPGTVSQWLSDRFPPSDDKLQAIARLLDVSAPWLRYGDNGAPTISEPKTRYRVYGGSIDEVSFDSPTAYQRGKVWIEQFLLELLDEGADQDFLSWARRLLLSNENYVLYVGGTQGEMTDEQKFRHMQGLGVGVRAILKDRLKKQKGK